MKYYIDTSNKPFVFEDNVTSEIIAKVEATHNTKLTEITLTDYEALTAPTFAELQIAKINEIKSAYQNQLKLGYICSNTINMDAEQDKVNTLKNGYDLAVKTNQATMDIRDYNNVVHTAIALADVDTMIIELGTNISTQLAKKWQLEAQVQPATTQAELDLIVW